MSRPRIAQPPISPARRDREVHDFWGGLIVIIIGAALLFTGGRHVTLVDTVDGTTAREYQLVKAFSHGGLEFVEPQPVMIPRDIDDPAAAAAALAQMERASSAPQKGKYRVNTGAVDPCPT